MQKDTTGVRLFPIENFTNYGFTLTGAVWSYRSNKWLKPQLNKKGYYMYGLYANSKNHTTGRHNIIYKIFNPEYQLFQGNKFEIDHVFGNPDNNHISNLQLLLHRDNSTKDVVGSSKYIGVAWNTQALLWTAYLYEGKKKRHLGCFKDEDEAGAVRSNALKEYLSIERNR